MKTALALLLCVITAIALAQGFQKPKTQKGSAQSLCTSSPAASALAMAFDPTAQPIFTTLQASVSSNGVQSFVFVSQWGEDQLTWNCLTDDATRDAFVLDAIGRRLADRQWCLGGWEISKRRVIEAPKPANLYIEGQCK